MDAHTAASVLIAFALQGVDSVTCIEGKCHISSLLLGHLLSSISIQEWNVVIHRYCTLKSCEYVPATHFFTRSATFHMNHARCNPTPSPQDATDVRGVAAWTKSCETEASVLMQKLYLAYSFTHCPPLLHHIASFGISTLGERPFEWASAPAHSNSHDASAATWPDPVYVSLAI